MTRLDDFDDEIGRGRRSNGNESSSSRDSSPTSKLPKRSFSPALSDAGEAAMQPIADDDTPPPQDRPIIRQALAFSAHQPPQSIVTYEASPATDPKFLPGQEVPIPPKPKATNPKRRPRREQFPGSGLVSRFRVETYDPTPSTEPPTDRGVGPYSSMYRGVIQSQKSKRRQSPKDGPSTASSTLSSQPSTSTLSSTPGDSNADTTLPVPPPQRNARLNNKTKGRRRKDPKFHSQANVNHLNQGSYSNYTPPPLRTQYYRRDYDSELIESSEAQQSQKRSKYPLRMVTLLIQDLRSGTTDHQLAEVKIPLKQNDHSEDGFWADAKDISQKLQMGPSRIDGPARAYTLRGKYRQFILRVSAKNSDEFMSSNVAIQPDRTLDVFVEMLHPPGAPPPPPKIPTELWLEENDDEHQTPEPDVDHVRSETRDSRKRINSPSFDDYDGTGSSGANPSKVPRTDYSNSPRHTSNQPTSKKKTKSTIDETTSHNSITAVSGGSPRRPPESPSPPPELLFVPRGDVPEEPITVEDPFILELDRHLQKDSKEWDDFFRARAGRRVCDFVKQYTYVMRFFDIFVGKLVHPQYPHANKARCVEEIDIIRALKIEEGEIFLNNCKEAIELLNLYAENGVHYTDDRVIEMIQDKSIPPYNSNSQKKLLHLLREVDEAWMLNVER